MQSDLFAPVDAVGAMRALLADLHDDLEGKVARYHQLADLSAAPGSSGTLLPGGETAFAAWTQARTSFVHGNYMATVLPCQGLVEHMLAAHLAMGLDGENLPNRISFHETLKRCIARQVLSSQDADDLAVDNGRHRSLAAVGHRCARWHHLGTVEFGVAAPMPS